IKGHFPNGDPGAIFQGKLNTVDSVDVECDNANFKGTVDGLVRHNVPASDGLGIRPEPGTNGTGLRRGALPPVAGHENRSRWLLRCAQPAQQAHEEGKKATQPATMERRRKRKSHEHNPSHIPKSVAQIRSSSAQRVFLNLPAAATGSWPGGRIGMLVLLQTLRA